MRTLANSADRDTTALTTTTTAGITATNVRKTYGGATVLNGVDFSVGPGEVHALLGANGAGKSTLLKVLTGFVAPDEKSLVAINGRVLFPGRSFGTKRSRELGLKVLHQEAPLVQDLTVAENIGLAHGFRTNGPLVSWKRLNAYSRRLLGEYEIEVDPWTPVRNVSSAMRAAVGLAITLGDLEAGPRCLILDEATATLPSSEGDRFLAHVRTAADKGASVVFVTHRLHEVHMIADQVTVLRAGSTVHLGPVAEISERELARHIVGHEREQATAHASCDVGAEVVVQASGLVGGLVQGADMTVRKGEILGLAGLAASGASTLAGMIAGAVPWTGGHLRVLGHQVEPEDGPRAAIRRGSIFLPADRVGQSGNPDMSVGENIALPRVGDYWMRPDKEHADVVRILDQLAITPADPWRKLGRLSGGNQQRALLGKWLLLEPKLLVLDEPTYGLDVGAADIINRTLLRLAAQGSTVVLASGDAQQVLDICNRVLVLRDGRVVDELTGSRLNKEELSLANR